MTVTVSDIWLAYEEALKDPFEEIVIRTKEQARKDYNNRQYYLDDDDCGISKNICNHCDNRFECLKRVR